MDRVVFSPCCLTRGQSMVEIMKIGPSKGPVFSLPHSGPPILQQATIDPCLCQRFLDNHGQVWVKLLSPGSWCTWCFLCALQESVSPVLCKFWWLYGTVNNDLLQKGLCHTEVCCPQSPCPCSRTWLTCTSTGNTQTFKGRSGSVSVGSSGMH